MYIVYMWMWMYDEDDNHIIMINFMHDISYTFFMRQIWSFLYSFFHSLWRYTRLFDFESLIPHSIPPHPHLIFHFRYSRSNRNIIQSEDEIENFHFRRRPTSFLCNTDPKRFTWMTAAEQDMAAANADGLRYFHLLLLLLFPLKRSCCRRCRCRHQIYTYSPFGAEMKTWFHSIFNWKNMFRCCCYCHFALLLH